ncbi:hypothetical protein RF11_12900 [Thelohanellus kitauei]|uniref:Uncharacterized protein n=1 Tax=Thelohanellus kitauei TaxID=669202 RepID=A0A0C2MAX0_THEKT|nr:hypothetical protein RF11_12900 [Thelohanellus kitauei]
MRNIDDKTRQYAYTNLCAFEAFIYEIQIKFERCQMSSKLIGSTNGVDQKGANLCPPYISKWWDNIRQQTSHRICENWPVDICKGLDIKHFRHDYNAVIRMFSAGIRILNGIIMIFTPSMVLTQSWRLAYVDVLKRFKIHHIIKSRRFTTELPPRYRSL